MNSENISKNEQLKETKIFRNLKSDYFLIKLFNHMKINKSLAILKYNKEIQKRLNININNYQECSQLYLSIELELELADYKYDKCSFIIIPDNEKEYYHIYFDNSNEEIKRTYLDKNEKVKIIRIKIDYPVKSFKGLFESCEFISSIFFKKFYRNNINDMSHMFNGCSSLTKLNISNFITNNVTDMCYMFSKCLSINVFLIL